MLRLGPDGHLTGARGDEHARGQRTGGGRKQDPAPDLERVVCARYVVKAKAARDDVALPARRPQAALDDVRPAAAQFGVRQVSVPPSIAPTGWYCEGPGGSGMCCRQGALCCSNKGSCTYVKPLTGELRGCAHRKLASWHSMARPNRMAETWVLGGV